MAVVVEKHAGALQLCAGQSAGVEAAIHAMKQIYEAETCDGILLLDAENAFNRVNRAAALWNIQYDCPALKCTVINTYRRATKIFVLCGLEIWSNEGTTQGCPSAMAMYAVAIIPLQELPTKNANKCGLLTMVQVETRLKRCGIGGIAWKRMDPNSATFLKHPNRG